MLSNVARTLRAYCKNIDEIRISCNCECAPSASRAQGNRAPARKFFRGRRHDTMPMQRKIILHSLACARVVKRRNRSKTSESVQVIRGAPHRRRRIFCATRAREFRFRSEILRSAGYRADIGARMSDARDVDARMRVRQRPSFFFRRSLTACGLTLPPEAFIA